MNEKEMPFLEHLEILRWHIIRALAATLVMTIVAFIFGRYLFDNVVFAAIKPDFFTYRMLCELGNLMGTEGFCVEGFDFTLNSRQLTGQFSLHLIFSFTIGIVLAFPYIFWEIWRFIIPALEETELNISKGAVFFVSLQFTLGALFGYFVLFPISLNFLVNYRVSDLIVNDFNVSNYLTTLTMIVIGCAIVFQLPMVVYALAKIGIVTPKLMRDYRKHSVLSILILAAVITPADVTSQTLVFFPVWMLYEISVFIAAKVEKNRIKAKAAIVVDE